MWWNKLCSRMRQTSSDDTTVKVKISGLSIFHELNLSSNVLIDKLQNYILTPSSNRWCSPTLLLHSSWKLQLVHRLGDQYWFLGHLVSQCTPLDSLLTTVLFEVLHLLKRGTWWHSGWGNALQTRRSRDQFLMVSLEFFIGIFLQVALWPWGWFIF
jgi:hypothetical protein